jgi:hypothetical protein
VKLIGLLAVLAAAGALAACGSDEASLEADCLKGFNQGYENASPDVKRAVPYGSLRQSAQRICTKAVKGGLIDEDDDQETVELKLKDLIEENPEVLYPTCIGAALKQFQALPAEQQTPALRREMERFGRRYCDAAIRAGYAAPGRQPTQAEISQLFEDNPELLTPVCVTSGMAGFERDPLVVKGEKVSRAKEQVLLTRICRTAVDRGYFSGSGTDLTPQQAAKVRRLAAVITRRMIASGELP